MKPPNGISQTVIIATYGRWSQALEPDVCLIVLLGLRRYDPKLTMEAQLADKHRISGCCGVT